MDTRAKKISKSNIFLINTLQTLIITPCLPYFVRIVKANQHSRKARPINEGVSSCGVFSSPPFGKVEKTWGRSWQSPSRNTSESSTKNRQLRPRPVGFPRYLNDGLSPGQTCSICLLAMRSPVQTVCGHRFCESCLLKAFRYCTQ